MTPEAGSAAVQRTVSAVSGNSVMRTVFFLAGVKNCWKSNTTARTLRTAGCASEAGTAGCGFNSRITAGVAPYATADSTNPNCRSVNF